jgi:hypothetical protein
MHILTFAPFQARLPFVRPPSLPENQRILLPKKTDSVHPDTGIRSINQRRRKKEGGKSGKGAGPAAAAGPGGSSGAENKRTPFWAKVAAHFLA